MTAALPHYRNEMRLLCQWRIWDFLRAKQDVEDPNRFSFISVTLNDLFSIKTRQR